MHQSAGRASLTWDEEKGIRELWVVGDGKVARFRGDFNDYKKETLARTAKRVAESVKSLSTINN